MDHQTQTLQISGITCDACIRLITKRLSRISGVIQVQSVDKSGQANVLVNSKLPKDAYAKALDGTGYSIIEVN